MLTICWNTNIHPVCISWLNPLLSAAVNRAVKAFSFLYCLPVVFSTKACHWHLIKTSKEFVSGFGTNPCYLFVKDSGAWLVPEAQKLQAALIQLLNVWWLIRCKSIWRWRSHHRLVGLYVHDQVRGFIFMLSVNVTWAHVVPVTGWQIWSDWNFSKNIDEIVIYVNIDIWNHRWEKCDVIWFYLFFSFPSVSPYGLCFEWNVFTVDISMLMSWLWNRK